LMQSGNQGGSQKLAEVLARFDAQVPRREAQVARLGFAMKRQSGPNYWQEGDPLLRNLRQSLRSLITCLQQYCHLPAYHLDPFAELPIYLPLFKFFHGIANQLGISPLNESFTHHLLLHAVTQDDVRKLPVLRVPFAQAVVDN